MEVKTLTIYKKGGEKMKWKRSSCGVLTDIDEDYCPRHGATENPETLQEAELSEEEFLVEYGKGNIYTKYIAQLEKLLKELRQKQKEAH